MDISPSFDMWPSVFLAVAVHGILLAAIFMYRRTGRAKPNRLLGIFLLLFSLNLIGNVLYWTRYYVEFPHLIGIQGMFQFLYGPLMFFYAVHIVQPDRKWKPADAVHLLPLVVFIIWMLPFYTASAEFKMGVMAPFSDEVESIAEEGFPVRTWIFVVIKTVLMAGYGAAVLLISRYGERMLNLKPGRINEEKRRWLQIAGSAFIAYVVSYLSYFILVESIDFRIEHDYMISFAMSFFIFGVGYMNLLKPSWLEEAHNGRYKYENSSLDAEDADFYLEKLLEYMEKEKPYLDGDLKINDLAGRLSVPSHHLSQIINERLDKNFFEFINSYRVSEAREMLSDPRKKDFKILRIAFESGFNNKTTFNIAFKEEVGTTPSSYRRQQLEEEERVEESSH